MITEKMIDRALKAAPQFWRDTRDCEKKIAKMLTVALSDQVAVPSADQELKLARSQLAECHKEIFKLREALVPASTPVRSS